MKIKSLFFLVLMLIVTMLLPNIVGAAEPHDYTVELATYAVAGVSTTTWANNSGLTWPMVTGNGRIMYIILANSGATIQTIDFYDTTATTATLTSILPVVLETTGTVRIPLDDDSRCTLNFTGGLMIKKSATGSTVDCTIIYR